MIPRIEIKQMNGALGLTGGGNDGVAGLVIGCDPGATGITVGDIFILRSIDDARTAKLDEIAYAYQQIKEFFYEAGSGAKLYVLVASNTETLTNMADSASVNYYGKRLLDYAGGEISLLGVCRKPGAGYTATTTKGMDDDSISAVAKMQALAELYAEAFKPFVGVVEGRKYQDSSAALDDLGEGSANYVGVVLSASSELHTIDADASSVGLVLGRASAVPVQRKVARVKDGGLSIAAAYLGSKTTEAGDWESVAEKGYIVVGQYAGLSGYYFIDDTLATVVTDDYRTISNRRVMNKMVRIVYQTYVNELNDDIEISTEGKLSPATAKYYQGIIDNAVNAQMTAGGELSSFASFVDVNQNVLSTGTIRVRCIAIPKGYSQQIEVTLGFNNPALSA